ncbi:osmoprotectant transport system substrate-binding protein [Melghirimyces profundicolus]|uniref:Osmoprotectant transport system substrate-binding protein n=1 Tax=Melghirimyces profundicolus TaxID=1242148 RepID=A0A2T6C7V5_9BACL|nr:glycine betaine ABC transporter substrate-binding protein [Melghirimyces profundicolus]PTX64401.1 osmoprotectant transport system substrate-binding protein [Melghirimyces profundicolus]
MNFTWRSLWFALMIVSLMMMGTACGSSMGDGAQSGEITVGGKDFTEQHLLTKITSIYLKEKGYKVKEAGSMGSSVARSALENGQIDMYWEYTGTALMVFLKEPAETDPAAAFKKVKKLDAENDLVWLEQAELNNTYTILMRQDQAEKLNIRSLSDLAAYVKKNPKALRFATNAEFYSRQDGMKGLEKKYGFQFPTNRVKKMDSGILYNALKEKQVDVSVGFATDGRIKGFNLVSLEDDQKFFPVYHAAPVIRKDVLSKNKKIEGLLNDLARRLTTENMMELNYKVDVDHQNETKVAREWLVSEKLIQK